MTIFQVYMPSLYRGEERLHVCVFPISLSMAYATFDINCVFIPSGSHSYHSSHHLTLVHLFSHTNAYMHSFLLLACGIV